MLRFMLLDKIIQRTVVNSLGVAELKATISIPELKATLERKC